MAWTIDGTWYNYVLDRDWIDAVLNLNRLKWRTWTDSLCQLIDIDLDSFRISNCLCFILLLALFETEQWSEFMRFKPMLDFNLIFRVLSIAYVQSLFFCEFRRWLPISNGLLDVLVVLDKSIRNHWCFWLLELAKVGLERLLCIGNRLHALSIPVSGPIKFEFLCSNRPFTELRVEEWIEKHTLFYRVLDVPLLLALEDKDVWHSWIVEWDLSKWLLLILGLFQILLSWFGGIKAYNGTSNWHWISNDLATCI